MGIRALDARSEPSFASSSSTITTAAEEEAGVITAHAIAIAAGQQ